MRFSAAILTALCPLLALVPKSEAPSILLGSIDANFAFSGTYTGGSPITQQYFVLTYQTSSLIPPAAGGGYAGVPFQESESFPFTYCVGCDRALTLGWTGTTDFAGGIAYDQFTTNLADGVNDGSLWQLSVFLRDDGRIATATGDMRNESEWFTRKIPTELWAVDFIRLVVPENTVFLDDDVAFADVRYSARWEFWGTVRPPAGHRNGN
jgi:hypothetical protein